MNRTRYERYISLCEAQNNRCAYCGIEMYIKKQNEYIRYRKDLATFEHLHPKFLGGKHNYDNTVIACCLCNEFRGRLYINNPIDFYNFLHSNDIMNTKLMKRINKQYAKKRKRKIIKEIMNKSNYQYTMRDMRLIWNNNYIDKVVQNFLDYHKIVKGNKKGLTI